MKLYIDEAAQRATEQADTAQAQVCEADEGLDTSPAWMDYLKNLLGLSADEVAALEQQVKPQSGQKGEEEEEEEETQLVSQPLVPTSGERVAQVRSLYVDLQDTEMEACIEALNRAMDRRVARLTQAFNAVNKPEFQKQDWARRKADDLKADLEKTLDEVLADPDCRHVDAALRADIVKAKEAVDQAQSELLGARKAFHRFDEHFADNRVEELLNPHGLTGADLKALVAQESGDLRITDRRGDIAGPAQIGRAEAREAGAHPEDRLRANSAILLAAKVLVIKIDQLKGELKHGMPTGADFKRFTFASYNAGARTLGRAQAAAVKLGRDPTSWAALIEGGTASALAQGIKQALPGLSVKAKYTEVTEYVDRIFTRLTPEETSS